MANDLGMENVALLEHLLRVNRDHQPLFNSFILKRDQLRRCNAAVWAFRALDKLRVLYELSDVMQADTPVSDLALYALLEKLNLLFSRGPRWEEPQVLDARALTVALLKLLIRICNVVGTDTLDSKVRPSLQRSVATAIRTQFIAEYIRALWDVLDE
ncbi:LAME_0G08240g1_1 [Lachancea meyersii CBS 8951]|uniref:LAME_0G08240g1_1 n=1 Tax=Lachancea meyersii CBS 8951 TaxID=1266667 RepID=A0A1G4K858_9SACH|nr:LAME_0G08240g1_1 [Lachancea meyersii CBS 8951]